MDKMSLICASTALLIGANKSDPNASALDLFQERLNHANALATLLNEAQRKANFNPAIQNSSVAATNFKKFLTKIASNSYLKLSRNSRESRNFFDKNYGLLIDSLESIYGSIAMANMDEIKASLGELANTILDSNQTADVRALCGQFIIAVDELDLRFVVIKTQISMKGSIGAKCEMPDQCVVVDVSEYELMSEKIIFDAQKLSALRVKTAEDWIAAIKSTQNPSIKPCFL